MAIQGTLALAVAADKRRKRSLVMFTIGSVGSLSN